MPAPEGDLLFQASNARRTGLLMFALLAVAVVTLRTMGQPWWCKCGRWVPWSWDIWSNHNSQHLIDPYTFTHVLHGIILCGLLYWAPRTVSQTTRFVAAILLEGAWEILENCPIIIERYRAATISKDYFGDSVANSVADILACALGYWLAFRLRSLGSVIVFVVTEVILLVTIRDGLILNVVMLAWPTDIIRQWQLGL
jgi:hypothetical protein